MKGTCDKGLIIRPDKSRGLEMHVDANFAGNWDPNETMDQDTARSRHGYIITLWTKCNGIGTPFSHRIGTGQT